MATFALTVSFFAMLTLLPTITGFIFTGYKRNLRAHAIFRVAFMVNFIAFALGLALLAVTA